LESQVLKRALILLLFLLPVGLLFLSCGYAAPRSGTTTRSKFRAFVSQDVGAGAGLDIIDAQKDVFQPGVIGAGATPGMMVVTPNRNQTLVFSAAENAFTVINNASEATASSRTLPGSTASFVVSPDSQTAYVAVPTAKVEGQSPGAIEVVGLGTGQVTAEISCFVPQGGTNCLPDVHTYKYLSLSHSGNRLLAFSDNYNSVFVITPSNVGTGTNPIVEVPGFDRPLWAYFSNDDNTAYVVNCGAECGGTTASVQTLDLTTDPPTLVANVPVKAASVAVVDGTTMYLAGTPVPALTCTGPTQATSCGALSVVDLTNLIVTNSGILITDGNHSHIAMGANGQLFVGATICTEITLPNPTNEVRGCLSIYNTQTGAVVIPPANGDVTGIQPIANRSVVYLIQNGELQIYDTTTDKLQKTQIDLNGQAVDVKTIDF
jgi:hypothetical protein